MKKIKIVKGSKVKVKPFILSEFTQSNSIEHTHKITKKELKKLADTLGLTYDDKQISFTKKVITAYIEQ